MKSKLFENKYYDMINKDIQKVHLLSKSYPRSGHHFVADLLRSLYLDGFYYCERYQVASDMCCKTEPCTKTMVLDDSGRYRFPVSMQKSHDFQLTDPVIQTNPELKYLLFFRDFEPALASAMKLFLINSHSDYLKTLGIDSNRILHLHEKDLYRRALSAIDAQPAEIPLAQLDGFVLSSARHYVGFLSKWRAVEANSKGHAMWIQYEDLVSDDLGKFLEQLVNFIGLPPKVDLDVVARDNPLMDATLKKLEESQYALELMRRHAGIFHHYAQLVRTVTLRLGLEKA